MIQPSTSCCGILRRRWARAGLAVAAMLFSAAAGTGIARADEAAAQTDVAMTETAPAMETIRERYLDGRVKVEREVTTDADGNYVNHGAWRMWNPAGKLVAEGSYAMGRRAGDWTRWLARDEAPLLASEPFDQFDAPFVSSARFADDQLDGTWTIADAGGRKCSTVTFKSGKRNGPATLWLPSGQIYREATFRNALPVGDLRERNLDGELTTVATYVGGQQVLNKVCYFPDSEIKQMEYACLGATIIEIAQDDYWQLRFAEYAVRGDNLRHGPWKSWYSNGKLQSEGYYQYDRESGTFTWWHAHGQEAVKGKFTDGQPDGTWTWWHANGQKAAEGQYRLGTQVGTWRQWADDGRLVQRKDTPKSTEEYADSSPASRMTERGGPPVPRF